MENHRARWTNKENLQLYKEARNHVDLETIANNHKRTICAIKYRLIRYAIEMADENEKLTLKDLCNKTNLSRKVLIEGFNKLKYNYDDLEDDYPENHGNTWTDNETTQLYNEVENGIDIETIANDHKRTVNSIKYKLVRYAIEMSEKNKLLTIEDLSKLTTLSCEDLMDGFNKLKYYYFITNNLPVEVENSLIKFVKSILCVVCLGSLYLIYIVRNK
jgi:hypothetical protein